MAGMLLFILPMALPYYVLPIIVVNILIYFFSKRRLSFSWSDIAVLYLPVILWCFLTGYATFKVKSLSNIIELPYLAYVFCLYPILRLALNRYYSSGFISKVLLVLSLIITSLVWFFVPALPE